MRRVDLRVGDQERDAAIVALGEHYVAGRLTKEEYDDRSVVAGAARTVSELTSLFADLPATSAGPDPARRGARVPLLPLVLVLVGVAMLTDVAFVLIALGLLWWLGVFRWLRPAPRRTRPSLRQWERPRGRARQLGHRPVKGLF